MVSALAVVGLNWDGFDVQRADLDIFIEIAEGLDDLPDVRGGDQVIPFRTGRLPVRSIADFRPIIGNGWIAGSNSTPRAKYRGYLDALKAKLDPTSEPRVLAATLEDGTTRWIRAIPRNLLPGPGIGGEFRTFSIEWKACDPYWYGSWGALTLDSGLTLDDGYALDSGGEIVIAGAGDYTLNTLGSAEVERVQVRFVGPSSGPVGIETVGAAPVGFRIARTLASGEEIAVDNWARTALLGSSSLRNLMTLSPGNRHGEYIRLPAGAVTLRATGAAAQTRIQFLPAYQ